MRRFRLGATSFVHPGGWQHNVERLGDCVQDVEILFFEADGPHCWPDRQELRALAELKARHGLTYSLHTPLAASLASLDEARRQQGVRTVLAAIAAAEPLAPEAYVLHVYLGDQEHAAERPQDLHAWRRRAAASLHEILAAGVPAERCCIELIDYDFALIEPVVSELGLSIALDIGHLHRDGAALRQTVLRYLPSTRIIQWHGTDETGRDHRGLQHFPERDARWLLRTLAQEQYAGVFTLEVFRADDFASSLVLFERWQREVDDANTRAQNSMPR
ncbi:MAG TPA: cobamide remodeling phosphodiesterase CbiR [Polyangiales bacterium]